MERSGRLGSANSSDDLPSNLDDTDPPTAIVCPICYCVYDEPKLLNCGHTVCLKCIRELARLAEEEQRDMIYTLPKFSCPECRTLIPVSAAETLRTNYRLADVIHQFKIMKTGPATASEEKPVAKSPPEPLTKCTHCNEGNFLCGTCCVNFHNGHRLISMDQMTNAQERQNFTSEIMSKIRQMKIAFDEHFLESRDSKKELANVISSCIEHSLNSSGIEKLPANNKTTKEDLAKFQMVFSNLTSTFGNVMAQLKGLEYDYEEQLRALMTSFENEYKSQVAVHFPSAGFPLDFRSNVNRMLSSERPWENPWEEALERKKTYTEFKEVQVDWDYIQRLIPKETIPPMPMGPGPYPSGWQPPKDPAPELPYFIKRNRYHLPSLYLERRRDQLNPDTMDFEYVEIVTMKDISGDIFECEKDLKKFVEDEVGHPIGTFVDELKGIIKIRGAPRHVLEEFPVSVCNSCYAQLTGQKFIPGPNLNKNNVEKNEKSKNWWGNDELPPPSMRRDYMKPKQKISQDKVPEKSKVTEEMEEIQARLAKLQGKTIEEVKNPRILITGKDENGEVPKGAKILDSFNDDKPTTSEKDSGAKPSDSITVAEIEQRLAALRGVPVEVIRKPRLMVMDDEEDSDCDLPEEAMELLKEAERKSNGVKRKTPGYYENEGLNVDDDSPGNRESTTSLDSTTFKKIVKDCEDTPSIASSVSSFNPFPNFAEQCKKIKQDAVEAERQATLFIQESENQIPPPVTVRPTEGTQHEKNTLRPGDSRAEDRDCPETPRAMQQKKHGGFFSKLFKSHSKDNI
ncbi:hypothetical protein FO519_008391 [Halicephalobus sp. NKZ332]|nr:hypothetical protein FO519_008391 [Halicephalobus sp. NKZ332]